MSAGFGLYGGRFADANATVSPCVHVHSEDSATTDAAAAALVAPRERESFQTKHKREMAEWQIEHNDSLMAQAAEMNAHEALYRRRLPSVGRLLGAGCMLRFNN